LKAIALFLALVFVVEAFVQLGSSEQPKPLEPIPGIRPHYGSGISDNTLIIKQGLRTWFHITWWTHKKEEEMPLENYTVEMVDIRDAMGEKITMPKGMEITYRVTRDPEKEPPYERKAPYNTCIHIEINTSMDTPTSVYVLYLRSKGYGEYDHAVTVVVVDKACVNVPPRFIRQN